MTIALIVEALRHTAKWMAIGTIFGIVVGVSTYLVCRWALAGMVKSLQDATP